jgi:hypothetical protein
MTTARTTVRKAPGPPYAVEDTNDSLPPNGDGSDCLGVPEPLIPNDSQTVWDGERDKEAEREEKLFEELCAKYDSAIKTAHEWESMDIIPRKPLMGKWMKEGDLGFLFGERGSGKTWLVDAICTRISTGIHLFDWEVLALAEVLYVDGEMPNDDARARIKGMSAGNDHLHVLHHEVLFDLTGMSMNLTDPRVQKVITKLCEKRLIKLLVLDNLSCLFSGIKENEADDWEKVLPWSLDLRRRRIAVLIIAHGSRSGTMRGTSRREDHAFWVIKVEEVENRDPNEDGARFQSTFEKQRNSSSQEWTKEWTFNTEIDGTVTIGCTEISFDEKVLQLIQGGVVTATHIAEELKCSKATVSRSAQRLIDKKLIEMSGRNYRPRGVMNA